ATCDAPALMRERGDADATSMLRTLIVVLALFGATVPVAAARSLDAAPIAQASAVCANHPNQAAAQRAADTVDADGDGIYCESLPCPCLKPGAPAPDRTPTRRPGSSGRTGCTRPSGVQPVSF